MPLPFNGIVGYTGEVDLFQFIVGKENTDRYAAKFDPVKWPPTKDGLKTLLDEIVTAAYRHGTILNINKRSNKGVLICAYSRKYRDYEKEKDYDDDGVLKHIRGKTFHNDRLCNRPNGLRKPRQTNTGRDTTGDCKCQLRMNFSCFATDTANACIYLSRIGLAMHTHHPQPREGELGLKKTFAEGYAGSNPKWTTGINPDGGHEKAPFGRKTLICLQVDAPKYTRMLPR